jgi:outer membrane protein OmpA-like peptidoglycan-associated protein
MRLPLLCGLLCLAAALSAQAQTATPSAQQMVEQLRAPPLTRSLRNLAVEAAPVSRPSLSLLIQFDFDSARISGESQGALLMLAQALQSAELRDARFAVEGHTDAKGGTQYNLRLSQQRAEAVRQFLGAQGVDESRLLAAGKGSSQLAVTDQPYSALNRRVRIVNLE